MDNSTQKSVTSIAIVNRFFPPDPAITGRAACELADFLQAHLSGARLRIFATGAEYSGGRRDRNKSSHDVHRVRSYYSGKLKLLRLAATLYDGLRLAWAAAKYGDIVISLTDPPLIGLWMGFFTRLFRRRWIEWTMDLYPEAFAAANLISPHHPLYRMLSKAVRQLSPDQLICLGPEQYAFVQSVRGPQCPALILPCGVTETAPGSAPGWRLRHPGRTIIAYAGNLGEAHSLDVVEQLVLRSDPDRITFLLSPYGSKAPVLRSRLVGTRNIEWRDHVAPSDLAHADVHVASLTRRWTHVCVPSKAVSAVCLGRPLIYAGVPESDNWSLLKDAGWLIPETQDGHYAVEDIDDVLRRACDPAEVAAKTIAAREVRARLLRLRQDALWAIAEALRARTSDPTHTLSRYPNRAV